MNYWVIIEGSWDIIFGVVAVAVSLTTFIVALGMVHRNQAVTRIELEKLHAEMDTMDMNGRMNKKTIEDVARHVH